MNGAGAGRLPEFCRSELCTVLHGHAVCNGRDRQKRTKFKLRTRGSWVQILPGAPFFKGLERKTKFSLLLWDRCGTLYPPVHAT